MAEIKLTAQDHIPTPAKRPEMLSLSKSASEAQLNSIEKPIIEYRKHKRFQSYLMPENKTSAASIK